MSNLKLFDCGMGAEGVPHLASALAANNTLTKLDLGYNEIGAVAAQHIAEALKVNATVTELNICHNEFGLNGAEHLASALAANATLTNLNVLKNDLIEAGARTLVAVSKSKPNQIKSPCGIAAGATVDLYEHGLDPSDAVLFAFELRINATLTKLYFGYNEIGDVGAQHIAEALKVNAKVIELELDLHYNGIEDFGAQHIAEALEVNAAVIQLNLNSNEIGAVGAQHLAEALKVNATVTKLDICHNQIGDVGANHLADALAANVTLTSIGLLQNRLTEAGARALVAVAESKPNQIKSLCGITPDATSVDLYDHGLDAADAMLLAFDLRVNTTMTKLDLGGNHIGAVGMQHITEAL